MDRETTITEARKNLAGIVDRVEFKGENYVIVRHGQPAAAIVPLQVYRQWQREREALFQLLHETQAANADADPTQVERDILAAQQSLRRAASE